MIANANTYDPQTKTLSLSLSDPFGCAGAMMFAGATQHIGGDRSEFAQKVAEGIAKELDGNEAFGLTVIGAAQSMAAAMSKG